jgi:hypothetical protein
LISLLFALDNAVVDARVLATLLLCMVKWHGNCTSC